MYAITIHLPFSSSFSGASSGRRLNDARGTQSHAVQLGPPPPNHPIHNHRGQQHHTRDGKRPVGVDIHKCNGRFNHAQNRHPDHDTDQRTLPAAQGAGAEHRARDAIHLVSHACSGRGHALDVTRFEDRRDRARKPDNA